MHSDYLFVYGTLLKDVENGMSKFLAKHSEFIGKGYFFGKLYQISWFPGAIASSNSLEKVYGSLFKLTDLDSVFKKLDEYEGVGNNYPKPNLYRKKLIPIFLDNGSSFKAWVYLYNLPIKDLKLIDSGDFLKFSSK